MTTQTTAQRKQQSADLTHDRRTLPFVVAQADYYGFGFGGDVIAQFSSKGDAFTYAKEVFGRSQTATRVWSKLSRQTEFTFGDQP
jgi:hypothetical protein